MTSIALRHGPVGSIKPHTLVMSVLLIAGLVVGYLLLPGESERIAMLERDGQQTLALKSLERRFDAGDRSQRTLFQLQEIYEQHGDLAKAKQTLEMLAEQRPRDAQVQRRLAAFYKATQDEAAYMATLRQQVALRYSDGACRELIGIHRLNGNGAEEQAAIVACRQKGYRRTEDLVRLAHFHAAGGENQQAVQLLRSIDDLRRLRSEKDKIKLISLLLELDQGREANRRAVRWLRGAKDEALALVIIEMLVDDKRIELAMELARDVSVPGDAVSLAVAELMLERGQTVAARSYLRGWIEKAVFASDDMIGRFIVAAIDANDPENALAGARKFGLENLGQQDLAPLAEALAASGRNTEFKALKELITPETVERNPLLGAALQMSQGAPEATRQLLAAVQVEELDEWRLALWARLMEQTGRQGAASQALRGLGVDAPIALPNTRSAAPKKVVRVLRKSNRLRARAPAPAGAGGPAPTGLTPASKADSQAIFNQQRN